MGGRWPHDVAAALPATTAAALGGGGGGGHRGSAGGHLHDDKQLDQSYMEIVRSVLRPPSVAREGKATSWLHLLEWGLALPLKLVFSLSIVDCRHARYEKLYVLTMALSICWLGLIVSRAFVLFTGICRHPAMTMMISSRNALCLRNKADVVVPLQKWWERSNRSRRLWAWLMRRSA